MSHWLRLTGERPRCGAQDGMQGLEGGVEERGPQDEQGGPQGVAGEDLPHAQEDSLKQLRVRHAQTQTHANTHANVNAHAHAHTDTHARANTQTHTQKKRQKNTNKSQKTICNSHNSEPRRGKIQHKQTFVTMQEGVRGAEGIIGHGNLSTGAHYSFVIVRCQERTSSRVAEVERLEVSAAPLRTKEARNTTPTNLLNSYPQRKVTITVDIHY